MATRSVNGKRSRPESFSRPDVVLDMGVGPYETIQLGGVVFLVGVVTPEPVLQVGEQRCLRPGVQRLASDDQPSGIGPRRQVNKVGDLTHRCRLAAACRVVFGAVLVKGWPPPTWIGVGGLNRSRNRGLAAGHHREPDVAVPQGINERSGGSCRVGTDHYRL